MGTVNSRQVIDDLEVARDEYVPLPRWGVVRSDGEPWPRDEYPQSTVDGGRVLVCDGAADAAACTLNPGDPDIYPCRVVHFGVDNEWSIVDDHDLLMSIRDEEECARVVAEAVEQRIL